MSTSDNEWKSHTTAEGMTYFYNSRSGETAWERPAGATPHQGTR